LNLAEQVLARTELAELDPAARRLALRNIVARSVDPAELGPTVASLAEAIDGFGPLSDVMNDPRVTDVLVNGHAEVWVERRSVLELTGIRFENEAELRKLIERIVGEAGSHVDVSHPIADARLSDGSRLHVVLPPVAPGGPLLSIRRWPPMPYSLEDLVAVEMLSGDDAGRLRAAVSNRATLAISGSTGSGKTTLLNALLGCIDPGERIVTIEETAEFRPRCAHCVSLLAREANIEGNGKVTLFDLVRTSLRMRPDRIIVGEVRGGEMLAALTALSTGHPGSMLTVHARSAEDAIDRMVMLARSGDPAGNERWLRRRIEGAFDYIIHVDKSDGRRAVTAIEEIRTLAS
jgi:pilus assembly protein CpaF